VKAISFVEGCEPEGLVVSDCEVPKVFGSQVLVKVMAFGINRADTLQRKGMYPPPKGESSILGLEVAGVVVERGPDAAQWTVGDKVFGLVAGGGYAEYVSVEQSHLMPMPSNLSFNEAAAIAEVFLTAYQALFGLGGLKQNQSVLIHAGASGVGLAAIQLATQEGCSIAVTASTEQKLDACKKSGASLCVNYGKQNFKEVVRQHIGGVDLIIDVVGGEYLNDNIRLLNMDATIVQLAMLGGRYTQKFDMAMMLSKRATIKASTLRNRCDDYKTRLITNFQNRFLSFFEEKRLTPVIDTVFPVNQIAKTHERLESNDSIGKFVVSW
jgi:putative PIG3 family NAD(P)H quinone oxidoreductase